MRRFARLGSGNGRGSDDGDPAVDDDATVIDLSAEDRLSGAQGRADEDDDDDDDDDATAEERAQRAEAKRAADLLERLLDGVNTRVLGNPVERVNERTPFVTRWSPIEFGFHDGLAAHPDGTTVTPSAVATLHDEQRERSAAIDVLQEQASVQLKILVRQRQEELALAEHQLHEAMYQVVARHPRGSRSGFYGTPDEVKAAIADARRTVAEREAKQERDRAKADEAARDAAAAAEAAPPAALDEGEEPSPEAADPTVPLEAATRTTEEQRVAASMELAWSLRWYWFWIGSAILLTAEFPFMRAVVRQLLLERKPSEAVVLASTVSITVGFLIATKLTGMLLRRAQSMLLLAKLIDPSRRPLLARTWGRITGRTPSETGKRKETNPTEEGLRFGAWSRLFGALLLTAVLFGTVFSIADFRSQAASSVAAQNQAEQNDRFGGTPSDAAGTPSDASQAADLEEAFADVPLDTLQRVFLSISLLNVVGAIALAWASTKVPWEELPPEEAGDWSTATDIDEPSIDPEDADPEDEPVSTGRPSRRERRRRARSRMGARLEADLQERREKVVQARTRLAAAEALVSHQEAHTRLLKDLSKAQGRLDETSYWWANRAVRRFEVDPETDVALAEIRDRARQEPVASGAKEN